MYAIKTLNKISPSGLDLLDKALYRCADDIESPDAVLVRSADMHAYPLPASLKAIARAGAGVNNIPVDQCAQAGIAVFNTPGANANAVKEMVLTGLLLSSRKVVQGIQWASGLAQAEGKAAELVEKGKSKFTGPELLGKKLGIIGLGAVGGLVANAAIHLGMEVYGYDPYIAVDAAWKLSREVIHASSLKEIYENCDYITIHVPALPDTKGMINSESLHMMKNGVRILNFARGSLVVNSDIKEALASGKAACYVTDFPEEEILGVEGVIAIPHLGASTPESEDNCAAMAAQELKDFLENGNITNSVNYPDVSMPRSGGARIGVFHRNIPNMISQITNALSSEGINIENLTNKSKKDYAYTLLDAAGDPPQSSLEVIGSVEGVIRVIRF